MITGIFGFKSIILFCTISPACSKSKINQYFYFPWTTRDPWGLLIHPFTFILTHHIFSFYLYKPLHITIYHTSVMVLTSSKYCNCLIELKFSCILIIFSAHFSFPMDPFQGRLFPYSWSTVFRISFCDGVLVAKSFSFCLLMCLFLPHSWKTLFSHKEFLDNSYFFWHIEDGISLPSKCYCRCWKVSSLVLLWGNLHSHFPTFQLKNFFSFCLWYS